MPSGVVHTGINLALGGTAALLGTLAGVAWEKPFWQGMAVGYLVGTFFITPDVDHYPQRRTSPVRFWGRLGFIWIFYGILFRHRGTSHSWLLGPLTRLIYLGLLGLPLWWILAQLELLPQAEALWGALLGYYLSQWVHLALDRIPLRRI
jgi:uncharacterized metal-binding protein